MTKTKQELLNHFSDINAMYNNPFMYQTLSNMIDELLEQHPCEDCISREAVEKITWEEPSYTDALNVLTEVREKVRALPSVTPKAEWIPCSERLPEREGWYLISLGEKTYGGADVDMYCKGWVKYGTHVLAWMPLPPCYEPQESEGEE